MQARAIRSTRLLASILCTLGLIGAIAAARAQRGPRNEAPPTAEFHFARMIYEDAPRYQRFGRGGGGWWSQDWPDAEVHFTQSLKRLTRIDAGESVVIELTDDAVFDYPWLYATQVGYWDLSDLEVERLREYLMRGGFLMVDDFFGEEEWIPFQETMTRLFPDRPIIEIDADTDEILHVLYDIDKFTQIPGLRHLGGGFGGRRGRRGNYYGVQGLPEPYWRGIYDDDGRLMIAMNFNQDVGDAWEHADDSFYPAPMTALAYRFGVNYVVYAMTH